MNFKMCWTKILLFIGDLFTRIGGFFLAIGNRYLKRVCQRLDDDPDMVTELEEVFQKHEKWDGKSPHPYGCYGYDGPDHCSYCGKELNPGNYVGVNKDKQAFCQECWLKRRSRKETRC